MATKTFKAPVSIQIYLGSGKEAEALRTSLVEAAGTGSVSELVVSLIRKAAPQLFKEEQNGRKR